MVYFEKKTEYILSIYSAILYLHTCNILHGTCYFAEEKRGKGDNTLMILGYIIFDTVHMGWNI